MEFQTHNQENLPQRAGTCERISVAITPARSRGLDSRAAQTAAPRKNLRVVPLPLSCRRSVWELFVYYTDKQWRCSTGASSTAARHLTVMYSSKLVLHTQNRVQPGRVASFVETQLVLVSVLRAAWSPKDKISQKPKSRMLWINHRNPLRAAVVALPAAAGDRGCQEFEAWADTHLSAPAQGCATKGGRDCVDIQTP